MWLKKFDVLFFWPNGTLRFEFITIAGASFKLSIYFCRQSAIMLAIKVLFDSYCSSFIWNCFFGSIGTQLREKVDAGEAQLTTWNSCLGSFRSELFMQHFFAQKLRLATNIELNLELNSNFYRFLQHPPKEVNLFFSIN